MKNEDNVLMWLAYLALAVVYIWMHLDPITGGIYLLLSLLHADLPSLRL